MQKLSNDDKGIQVDLLLIIAKTKQRLSDDDAGILVCLLLIIAIVSIITLATTTLAARSAACSVQSSRWSKKFRRILKYII